MYYFSMLLVIVATLFYHVSQKSINENISPVISMTVTYGVALILSIISIFFFQKNSISMSFKQVNWASFVLGFSIFIMEIGFLFVYRSGWNINIAGLFANVISAIIIIFIGIYIFRENLSLVNLIGILMSIMGLILMKK